MWGAHEGSLLLRILSLSLWAIFYFWLNRGKDQEFLALTLAVLNQIIFAFIAFTLFTSNPFDRILPIIPIVGLKYKFQPILVTDVANAIMKSIQIKNNEGKIYEIGGPKIISFGDMVKSILTTINKKRFVVEMPMTIAKIQSSITDLLPLPPILTRDQCEILSEADNIVSNNHLTLQDLNVKPSDVEEAMKKWLWRFRDGGQFAKVQ